MVSSGHWERYAGESSQVPTRLETSRESTLGQKTVDCNGW